MNVVLDRFLAEVKPDRRRVKDDVVAGLPGAISSVPDGMAASVLAGVNPVCGLYASGFGPIAGGLTSSFTQMFTIMRVNRIVQVAMISTLIATLLLPVAAAVGVGARPVVAAATQSRGARPDRGRTRTPCRRGDRGTSVGKRLATDSVTELDVYGSPFYAGAQTLRAKLPDPAGARRPVVVLRLRGRTSLGATFVSVIDEYSDRLHHVGGRLYLSGVDPAMMDMLERTNQVNGSSHVRAFGATATLGEATAAASEAAETWLITSRRANAHDEESG